MSKLLMRAGLFAALMFTMIGSSGCTDPVECESSDDCEGSQICGDDGTCAPNTIIIVAVCTGDDKCSDGQICDAGKCIEGCRTSAGCDAGEACVQNSCVAVGDACETSSECPPGLRCIDNACFECEVNSQCAGGNVCVDNACQACTDNSQCDNGKVCDAGSCGSVPVQCNNIGDTCVEGAPTRRGFVCAKFEGDDDFYCYDECQPREFCSPGFLNDPSPTGECQTTADCGPGQRCTSGLSGKSCAALPTCSNDGDCASVPDSSCVAGTCAFACTTDDDCNGGGICDAGSCRACQNDGDCANGFFCNAGSCIGEAFLYFEGEACPLGEICDADVNGVRACRRSECEGPIAGQPTCDAVAAANPDAYPNGAVCAPRLSFKRLRIPRGLDDPETTRYDEEGNFQEFAQQGFFCEPAGTQQEGDPCGFDTVGVNKAHPQCAQGLTCSREIEELNFSSQFDFWEKEFNLIIGGQTNVRGLCQRPCSRDEQCGVGESCIGEDRGQANGLGFCGVRCEPYTLLEEGACPEGTACRAISSTDGWCGELTLTVTQAMQNQDIPFVPAAGDGFMHGPCPNGDEDCPHNSRCLNIGSPRCVPQCDPTLQNQQVRDATCVGGNPDAYVKFIHLAQGAPDVDIYVDGVRVADDVTFETLVDSNGGWFKVTPEEHTISIVRGTAENARNPLLVVDFVGQANVSTFAAVLPDPNNANGIQVLTFADERLAPEPAADTAALRLAHAIPGAGNVDVVAVAAGGDITDQAAQVVLTEDFPEGALTDYLAIPGGSFDIYIFGTGDARTELTALATLPGVTVTAGNQGTFFAFGAAGAQPRTPGAFLAEHQTYIYTPVSGGYCYDLNQGTSGATAPSSGVCLQRCDEAIDWIQSPCENPSFDACSVFTDDVGVCFMRTGKNTTNRACDTTADCNQGEACNDEGQCVEYCAPGTECCTVDEDCGIGTFCDAKGANAAGEQQLGVCRSYCSTNGDDRFPTCGEGETCIPTFDIEGLGECRIACQPDAPGSFKSSSCPEYQQTCLPNDENRITFCQASGETAMNEDCQGTDGNTALCTPGTVCARDINLHTSGFTALLDAFVNDNDYEGESCHQLCRPFLPFGQNDCEEGWACSPILPTQAPTTFAGVCQPAIDLSQDSSPEYCDGSDIGKMCGNAAYCTTNDLIEKPEEGVCEAVASCLYLCDPATKTGCPPDKECQGLGSVDFPSFFIGAYGICRDR
ncbi:MAG: DUF4397 domain-containing protein [Myxococcota bacterium]|nr:DUF4397 domain-containing protein [Myxococcota bacterium]